MKSINPVKRLKPCLIVITIHVINITDKSLLAMAEIPQAIQNHNGEEGMDVDTEEVKLKISFFPHFSIIE